MLKKRTAARGWVTRASRGLEEVLRDPDVSEVMLEDAIETFDKRLASLDEIQEDFEVFIEVGDMEAEVDAAYEFRKNSRKPRQEAVKRLAQMRKQDGGDTTSTTSNVSSPESATLPKLDLPTFGGAVLEWPSFWEQFQAVVDSSHMPEITKFSYLLSLLRGDAKAAVKGLALTGTAYNTACEILRQRYGRKEQVIFMHMQELLGLSVLQSKSSSVSQLWKLQDTLLSHVRSLETFGVTGVQYDVVLTRSIDFYCPKFPLIFVWNGPVRERVMSLISISCWNFSGMKFNDVRDRKRFPVFLITRLLRKKDRK